MRELLDATRRILEERTDVAGWLEIYDLVTDYLLFFAGPFASVDREVAPDDPFGVRVRNQLYEFWLRQRDALRERFLTKWKGSPEVAARDFQAFNELMDTFFETGRYEDRWVFWAQAFPDEIHSNEEFRRSRHRRRAEALWKAMRKAFLEHLGTEFGIDPKRGDEEDLWRNAAWDTPSAPRMSGLISGRQASK